MKRIAVLTSGGDSPGMNACLRSVFRTANNMGIELVGVRRGYAGLVDGDMMIMTKAHVGNILQNAAHMKTRLAYHNSLRNAKRKRAPL